MKVIYKQITPSSCYILLILSFTLLSLFSQSSFGQEKTLTILNWQHYISPKVVKIWEKKSGNNVKFIYYDEEYQRDLILTDAKELNIDIVLMNTSPITALSEAKIISKIDTSKVPNIRHITPSHRQHCSQYAIPYSWGSLGIVYRKDMFTTPPSTWKDLFMPKKHLEKHVGMLRDMEYPFSAVLKMLGHPINTTDVNHLKQAYDILIKQAPKVLTYDYAISFIESGVKTDSLYMSLAYSGDHKTLNGIEGQDNWSYIIPQEGTTFWLDCWTLINSSKKKNTAYDFINFINLPHIAAMNSEAIHVATSNIQAKKLQSKAFANNPVIYPTETVLESSEFITIVKPKDRDIRRNILRAILKAHESE